MGWPTALRLPRDTPCEWESLAEVEQNCKHPVFARPYPTLCKVEEDK